VSVGHHQEIASEVGNPTFFTVLGCACQVGVQEVGGMALEAEHLIETGVVSDHKRTEGELQFGLSLAAPLDQVEQLGEEHPHSWLVLVPSGDVLRNLAAVERFVLLVEGAVGRMDKLALPRLFSLDLNLEGHVLQTNPGLTAVVVELVAEGLDLLDVAAVSEDPREGPADLLTGSSQEERHSGNGVGEDIASGPDQDDGFEHFGQQVLALQDLDEDGSA
jgi:hypothetical protein